MNVGAVGTQLIANHARACFVIRSRRVDGWNANEASREVDDLIARALDLGDDAIDSGVLHDVIVYRRRRILSGGDTCREVLLVGKCYLSGSAVGI